MIRIKVLLTLVALLAFQPGALAWNNMLINGSFEDPHILSGMSVKSPSGGSYCFWEGGKGLKPFEGEYSFAIYNPKDTTSADAWTSQLSWRQGVNLEKGAIYTAEFALLSPKEEFTVDVGIHAGTPAWENRGFFKRVTSHPDQDWYVSGRVGGWNVYTFNFVANSTSCDNIFSIKPREDGWMMIDAVSLRRADCTNCN